VGSVRVIFGAGGVFAQRFPNTEDRVAAKNLDDPATVQFEQGGAVVGTADEGAKEVHVQKREVDETKGCRCGARSGLGEEAADRRSVAES
jgi:hypothetical protein